MAQLSKMQQRIYDFIAETIQQQGFPPSVREIGDAVGLKSPSTVHFHLKHLEELGVIGKSAGKGRAITLTQEPQEAQEPMEDRIPIVGNVAAGSPILAQECIEDYLTFDTGGRADEYFALRVRGYSMKDAGILPDDLVVVQQQKTANNGEIVVALLEDEATVKRYKRKDGKVWLLAANKTAKEVAGQVEVEGFGRMELRLGPLGVATRRMKDGEGK
jgi:repressor LexA